MKSVISRKDLKHLPPDVKYAEVKREAKMYKRHGDDWICKMYWSVKEASEILGVTYFRINRMAYRMRISPGVRRRLKLTLPMLKMMANRIIKPHEYENQDSELQGNEDLRTN